MSGWVVGFAIGAAVAVVVVVLLLTMILSVRRVAAKADGILDALRVARDGSEALWRVADINRTAVRVVEAAAAARRTVAGDGEAGGARP